MDNNISVIIPTYRNPAYLDLCLKSATENKGIDSTEIIVIIDGFVEESQAIVDKYLGVMVLPLQENHGMQYALNVGVMQATNSWVFIVNDDNVFPHNWDVRLQFLLDTDYKQIATKTAPESSSLPRWENMVYTINQVEPAPSMFGFPEKNLGKTAEEFDYDAWKHFELGLQPKDKFTFDARIFPFLITKKWYMACGGFDTFYKSPFWCDCDFFTKLELIPGIHFTRYHGLHLYHFGGTATKTREDVEALMFKKSEGAAAQAFAYKWGYIPNLAEAVSRGNSKLPIDNAVKGITFK